jgi:hypothetical protein
MGMDGPTADDEQAFTDSAPPDGLELEDALPMDDGTDAEGSAVFDDRDDPFDPDMDVATPSLH